MKPNRHDWAELLRLLDTALELPEAERETWLAALSEIRRAQVRQLLSRRAAVETADFLAKSAALPVLPEAKVSSAQAGQRVGPWRLLREIGEGGMGSVWLADREDGGLKRQVALKLPRLSWVPGLAERMARERDILATLEHPHIARLYDAGLDEQGRPWLALEYVQGRPIDEHAREKSLDVQQRVRLLLQVCEAVAYAHSRLVIHRDLKPSNILVSHEGQVRLLDFGIAKLMSAESATASTDDGVLTQASGRALTPVYASPEQIRGDPIGTASDVYSLGVVAFELLTGRRPYALKSGLGSAALAEAVASIKVPQASEVASTPDLQRALQGDLDAILATALAAAAHERYATVQALADEISRHLRGEPVLARAPSRWYVAERWVRRHKLETAVMLAVGVATVGGAHAQVLVLLALGAGTLVALWQRNRALQHAQAARTATQRTAQVKDFIASIFTQAVPRAGSGGTVAAADLLRTATHRVETDLAGQPEVAAELSALIGASFSALGETQAGLAWLPKAVARCTREFGPTHPLTLQSRCQLAEAANSQGNLAVSEAILPALLIDLRAAQPLQVQWLLLGLTCQAFVHTKRGRQPESIAALHECVDLATEHFGASSSDALLARSTLSNTLMHFQQHAESLQAVEPAYILAQQVLASQRPHLVLAAVERDMAVALLNNHRPRDAAALLRRVLADQRALDGEETGRVRTAIAFLGQALMAGGHFEEAASHFELSDALHRRLTGGLNHEGFGILRWLIRVSVLQGHGAAALVHLARADKIECLLEDAGAALKAGQLVLHAEALAAAGRSEEVLAATETLLPQYEAASSIALRLWRARMMALRQLDRRKDALACARLALALGKALDGPALYQGLLLAETARCHWLAGEAADAAQQWRLALSVWQAGQVDGDALCAAVRHELAAVDAG